MLGPRDYAYTLSDAEFIARHEGSDDVLLQAALRRLSDRVADESAREAIEEARSEAAAAQQELHDTGSRLEELARKLRIARDFIEEADLPRGTQRFEAARLVTKINLCLSDNA